MGDEDTIIEIADIDPLTTSVDKLHLMSFKGNVSIYAAVLLSANGFQEKIQPGSVVVATGDKGEEQRYQVISVEEHHPRAQGQPSLHVRSLAYTSSGRIDWKKQHLFPVEKIKGFCTVSSAATQLHAKINGLLPGLYADGRNGLDHVNEVLRRAGEGDEQCKLLFMEFNMELVLLNKIVPNYPGRKSSSPEAVAVQEAWRSAVDCFYATFVEEKPAPKLEELDWFSKIFDDFSPFLLNTFGATDDRLRAFRNSRRSIQLEEKKAKAVAVKEKKKAEKAAEAKTNKNNGSSSSKPPRTPKGMKPTPMMMTHGVISGKGSDTCQLNEDKRITEENRFIAELRCENAGLKRELEARTKYATEREIKWQKKSSHQEGAIPFLESIAEKHIPNLPKVIVGVISPFKIPTPHEGETEVRAICLDE